MNRDLALAGGLALLAHAGAALLLRVAPIDDAGVEVGDVTVAPISIMAAAWEVPAPALDPAVIEPQTMPESAPESVDAAAMAAERDVEPQREPIQPADLETRAEVVRQLAPALAQGQQLSQQWRTQVAAAGEWTAACLATLVRDVRSWMVVRQSKTPTGDRQAPLDGAETAPAEPLATPAQRASAHDAAEEEGSEATARLPASVVRNEPPAYPTVARRRGYSGTVELRVEVLADGTAGRIELLKSSGYGVLDEAAMTSVRRWRFRPASRGGVSEPSWIDVPVIFRLERGGD